MRLFKTISITLIGLITIFLFTESVSRRDLTGQWYLHNNPDSSAFFSSDTLRFSRLTYRRPKDGGLLYLEDSSLIKNGKLDIYLGRDHFFFLGLARTDTIVPGGKGEYYRNYIHGKFVANRKKNELELRLHDCAEDSIYFINCKAPIIIKRYYVLECSFKSLVLVKLPR